MDESKPDIDAIEARANAATPGPWDSTFWRLLTSEMRSSTEPQVWRPAPRADREFVRHAQADVTSLVARVRELDRRVTELLYARSQRIAELEAEIARLRGSSKPGVVTIEKPPIGSRWFARDGGAPAEVLEHLPGAGLRYRWISPGRDDEHETDALGWLFDFVATSDEVAR